MLVVINKQSVIISTSLLTYNHHRHVCTVLHSLTQHYTTLHSLTQPYTALHSLTQPYTALPRKHRSFVVVLQHVSSIRNTFSHEEKLYLTTSEGMPSPVKTLSLSLTSPVKKCSLEQSWKYEFLQIYWHRVSHYISLIRYSKIKVNFKVVQQFRDFF